MSIWNLLEWTHNKIVIIISNKRQGSLDCVWHFKTSLRNLLSKLNWLIKTKFQDTKTQLTFLSSQEWNFLFISVTTVYIKLSMHLIIHAYMQFIFSKWFEKKSRHYNNYIQHANNFNILFRSNLPDRWPWKQKCWLKIIYPNDTEREVKNDHCQKRAQDYFMHQQPQG